MLANPREAAMTTLMISAENTPRLIRILKSYRSDLRMEIRRTSNRDFRESLVEEEHFLRSILRQLESACADHV